jgi:hypothetical protein
MPKAPTARTLFIESMKREGKYEEWRRRYKDAKKDVAPDQAGLAITCGQIHRRWTADFQSLRKWDKLKASNTQAGVTANASHLTTTCSQWPRVSACGSACRLVNTTGVDSILSLIDQSLQIVLRLLQILELLVQARMFEPVAAHRLTLKMGTFRTPGHRLPRKRILFPTSCLLAGGKLL